MNLPALPLVATSKNKLWLGLIVGIYAMTIYSLAGRWALSLDPQELPLTAIDRALPFIPGSYWIYSSVYLVFIVSCLVQRNLKVYSRFLYAYLLAYTLSALLFILFPTIIYREAYPLPPGTGPVTRAAFDFLRSADAPTNCLPSMHVASVVLSAAPLYWRRPRAFLFFLLWGLAISVATLTVKQHYFVDIVAGALFGLLIHWLVSRWPVSVRASADAQAKTV